MSQKVRKSRARIENSASVSARSAETGSGSSTLLFSHLSEDHTVFSIDSGGGSVDNVRCSPLLRPERVRWIEGPTQLTLPTYRFPHKLDAVLIDGPHGYPFPDMEYYYLYPHLQTGALLVVDDIQIPTIRNLFDFLRRDPMFDLREVVDNTSFFVRTDAPSFDQLGDGWWEQPYNSEPQPSPEDLHSLLRELAQLRQQASELAAIQASRGWKALSRYYQLRKKLFGI